MILLLRISLLSVLHLDFLSWSSSTAQTHTITAKTVTVWTQNQNCNERQPLQAIMWFPSSPLEENFKDSSTLHTSTAGFSPHLFTESAIVRYSHGLCLVKYSSQLPVFYWLIFLGLHSPGFQDTIFCWFSPSFLDALPVYSLKINGP